MDWDRTWVLVIEGARARIVRHNKAFRACRDGAESLVLRRGDRCQSRTDATARGGTPAATDLCAAHVEETRRFVAKIVDFLEIHRMAGDFDSLVLFAGQSMLACLSKTMTQGLRGCTIAAIPTDTPHRLDGQWWRAWEVPHVTTLH
jgi:protein required for attachment to host cells